MRNIRLDLAYDGTNYCGWQIQNSDTTVQGVIEECLSRIHKKEISIIGSGRTDSGVHADHQVANFQSDLISMPAEKFKDALNSLLPLDIRIMRSSQTTDEFHSRFDARKRTYKYYLKRASVGHPKNRDFSWLVRRPLELSTLNEIARELVGEHDFTTFTAAGDQSKSKIRYIHSAVFYTEGEFIVFKICGNAFLQKMVRSLTGSILDLAWKGFGGEKMKEILDAKDRSLAGPTAPARGLFLHKVEY